ncbi:MAG: GspE/PulE family protein [Armatimonadetes bacterium]|nr:GspE/PulE family protein [Armatimonadota bacterium]
MTLVKSPPTTGGSIDPRLGYGILDAPGRSLGLQLFSSGRITKEQFDNAQNLSATSGVSLAQALVESGADAKVVGPEEALSLGVEYEDLTATQPDPDALALVPENIIRATRALPMRLLGKGDVIRVAMVDPLDIGASDRIHHVTGRRVVSTLCMAGEFLTVVNELFSTASRTTGALQELETLEPDDDPVALRQTAVDSASDAPIVRLVDSIMDAAVAMQASDIHFEAGEAGLAVRFRVDGVLIVHAQIPPSQRSSVTARLKVLSGMDVTETRRPQDGRMRFQSHGQQFDIRVSSIRVVHGEKLVLRILRKSAVLVPLARLGFMIDQQRRFETMITQPHGMVLVVGPTGSGKSTTLYSGLNTLNDAKTNIMTLEDPVEYNVEGINQVQVNARIGLTFASGLRTFVRQDPDVILVGEIRDQETAEMAVQAALTGHLLLSTLHTNSAVGTITRLANLGLDQFLISQALTGVVSQRLVAKVCSQCAEEYRPTPETLRALGIGAEELAGARVVRGVGCRACHGRGLSGRLGIYEVLIIDEEMRRLIISGAAEDEMETAAVERGMRPLREAALYNVRQGITTPEEMGRVVLAKVL